MKFPAFHKLTNSSLIRLRTAWNDCLSVDHASFLLFGYSHAAAGKVATIIHDMCFASLQFLPNSSKQGVFSLCVLYIWCLVSWFILLSLDSYRLLSSRVCLTCSADICRTPETNAKNMQLMLSRICTSRYLMSSALLFNHLITRRLKNTDECLLLLAGLAFLGTQPGPSMKFLLSKWF